jgi:hypothetical protein
MSVLLQRKLNSELDVPSILFVRCYFCKASIVNCLIYTLFNLKYDEITIGAKVWNVTSAWMCYAEYRSLHAEQWRITE